MPSHKKVFCLFIFCSYSICLYLTLSVVPLGPVVASSALSEDKVVRTEDAPERPGPTIKSLTFRYRDLKMSSILKT